MKGEGLGFKGESLTARVRMERTMWKEGGDTEEGMVRGGGGEAVGMSALFLFSEP